MLGRYCVAFLLATVGVKVVSRIVLAYAVKNLADEELATSHRSPDGANGRG
jgi:hypothetical protein